MTTVSIVLLGIALLSLSLWVYSVERNLKVLAKLFHKHTVIDAVRTIMETSDDPEKDLEAIKDELEEAGAHIEITKIKKSTKKGKK